MIIMHAYALEGSRISIKGYARILYTNYRARLMLSNKEIVLPEWKNASPFVRNEFIEESRQLLR